MSEEFRYLFTPLTIGPVTVRNRVFSSGHFEALSANGLPTEEQARYHAEKVRGGIGLTILGQSLAYPDSKIVGHLYDKMVRSWDPAVVPGWRRIAEMVHELDGKVFVQPGIYGIGHGSYSASAIPDPASPRTTARPLSRAEIGDILAAYGKTAAHAREAGMDGVEVHDHGGLPTQFLSPFWNKRTDEYGGSLENRMRFLVGALESTRQGAGAGLAVGYRFHADERLPGGLTLEDSAEIARRLVNNGLVDFLDVDIAVEPQLLHLIIAPMYVSAGYEVYAAAGIREAIDAKVPVFTIGRITHPTLAERILADGQADMVGMTRAHICDPELVNKARKGHLDDIRPCLGDNEGCLGGVYTGSIGCTYNPATGREQQWGIGTIKPAEKRKRVVVVGGGPAGMEAARTAALRGHDVVLFEKADELGGQVNLAAMLPGREEMTGAVRWYKKQLQDAGVKIVLGSEATKETVLAEKPDAVVVATGATFRRDGFNASTYAPVPGGNMAHVVSVEDVLLGRATVGEKVVIYDDFGFVEGLGLAERLADQGKQVQIVTKDPFVGKELGPTVQLPLLYRRVLQKGVQFVPNTRVTEIGAKVSAVNPHSGDKIQIEADTVVFITAKLQNDGLYHALSGKVDELYLAGDCATPFNIRSAVTEGHKVGRLL